MVSARLPETDIRLWHASPTGNHMSILNRGLVPHWEWVDSRQEYDHCPIHLSVGYHFGSFICDLFSVEEVDVWEITGQEHLTLHPGEDGIGTFAVYQWIRPEWLRFYRLFKA